MRWKSQVEPILASNGLSLLLSESKSREVNAIHRGHLVNHTVLYCYAKAG